MKSRLSSILLKRVTPVVAAAAMVSVLYGTATFASTNTINADLGDTLTIGAGYYEEDTVINVPTLESQTSGTAAEGDILSGKKAWVNGAQLTGSMANYGSTTGAANTLANTGSELYVKPSNAGYYTSSSSFNTGIAYAPAATYGSVAPTANAASVTTGSKTRNTDATAESVNLGINSSITIPAGYYTNSITVNNGIKKITNVTGAAYTGNSGSLGTGSIALSSKVSGSAYSLVLGSKEQVTLPSGFYDKDVVVANGGGTLPDFRLTITLRLSYSYATGDGTSSGSPQETWIYEIHDGVATKISGATPSGSFGGGYGWGSANATIVSIGIEVI